MAMQYYVIIDNLRRGPFARDELAGQGMRRETLVWFKGQPDWLPANRVADLLDLFDEPPPLPGAEPAPLPRERPPIPDREPMAASEQIKDPDLALPRMELPRPEMPPPGPAYRDDADEIPAMPHRRIPYDVVGLRRLYLAGALTYFPGLVLVLAVLIAIAYLSLYGIRDHHEQFDLARRQFQRQFDPAARTLQTLAAVGTVSAGVLGLIGMGVGAACFLVLLYRAWAVIQDGKTRPTPGRAVGFKLIPLFNIYWDFVADWGLAWRLNRFARRHEIDAPSASQPLGWALAFYNILAYIPVGGLVAVGLNLSLWPLFMRSVHRNVAVLCDDANRERIANAAPEPTLRQLDLERPVSANILSIAATVLAPIAVGLIVGGFCSTLHMLGDQHRDAESLEAQRDAARQLRDVLANEKVNMVDWQDQNRLRHHEEQANRLEHRLSIRRSEDLIIGGAVLGGGVVLLAITITLAFVSRACAQGSDTALSHAP
jgi:hypothetical protein